ncbi:LysR family transcriptional regulator [uncultured Thiothrix sp.]|uniref:LysR family transcriptional regulator n=1 Tax=uncultured Thiothrix sp. TaxID=223185 RepID=UPI0026023750|nr:LysR family transcriptional regulator [uncultured Thiothrix sp.]
MQPIHLARIDLNLLVVFEAVARCQSVTVAAEQLALSQSAISHALKRLRLLLEDELVVRGRNGLVLTPRAESLLPRVQQLLADTKQLFNHAPFDAASTQQCFKVAASDYSIATFLPRLIAILNAEAPQARLEIENYSAQTLTRLEQGELDAAFIGNTPPTSPFSMMPLIREHLVGLMSQQHPLAHKLQTNAISLEEYLRYRHIVVSFKDPQPSAIDVELAQWGLKRSIAMSSPNMLANIAALANTDLIMNVPSRLLANLNNPDLLAFELPLKLAPQHFSLIWHKRLDGDLALAWLRSLVTRVL